MKPSQTRAVLKAVVSKSSMCCYQHFSDFMLREVSVKDKRQQVPKEGNIIKQGRNGGHGKWREIL